MIGAFTTETQRTQRGCIFPWPGDGGQGKAPPPSAEALWGQRNLQPRKALISGELPGGLHSFFRASLGVPPFGRVPGLPDRRLPIGQKKVSSVLSVPLW
jgi:hypothetical protein